MTAAFLGEPVGADRLTTARLVVRPHAADDAVPLARLVDNWNVVRWLAEVPFPFTAAAAQDWLARAIADHAAGSHCQFAIERVADARLVGQIGLKRARDGGAAELGYWIGQAHWGRGYAGEAAAAVVAYGFQRIGLATLSATCLADNHGSLAVLAGLGFRAAGTDWRSFAARRARIEVPLFRLDRAAWGSARLRLADPPS